MSYLLDAIIVIALFARLAQVQVKFLYVHAFAVVVLQEILGVALLFAIGGSNPHSQLWLIDWSVLVVSVFLGIKLGRWCVFVERKADLPD
ncbi:hypothetical protein [Lysobacter sp. CA199]|uniref:hypothetical protein n=1 Tax=Lysobacter sp. CA199 TaxID=3455608 RepID=UPI003F8D65C2